jgi:hypothetical protein
MQAAHHGPTLKFGVFGTHRNRLSTAHRVELHRPFKDEKSFRIVRGADGIAAPLNGGEVHPFGGLGHSVLRVEGQTAGLDVNLAARGNLGG